MRNKHKKHHGAAVIITAAMLTGCLVMGCSAVKSEKLDSITGKDISSKVEIVTEKAGRAAEKTGEAAKKIKQKLDRLIEKAGGKEEIAKKVGHIISQFGKNKSRIKSAEDIDLKAVDSTNATFRFTYGGENFRTVYSYGYDTWTIYDSYKITNEHDMKIICQALIDIHPVHGSDLKSYRTAKDMAYEWKQHNIVYELLPDSNRWKSSAKDVDLDPYDQGKSYKEIYEDRTGKEFNIKDFI